MGSGIAKQIREKYPEVYEADLKTLKGDIRKLGGYSYAMTADGLVFNLYGQFNYGKDGKRYTDYDALYEAMVNMAMKLRILDFKGKIGLPKLGAALGGGKWEIIEKAICKAFVDYEVIVYVL